MKISCKTLVICSVLASVVACGRRTNSPTTGGDRGHRNVIANSALDKLDQRLSAYAQKLREYRTCEQSQQSNECASLAVELNSFYFGTAL